MKRPAPLAADEFLDRLALAEWQVEGVMAIAEFTLTPYAAAASLVAAIGEAADAADHHPEVHLRYPGVVRVELTTHWIGALSELDVQMAATVSTLARQRGATVG